jgi:hypothetical protein
MIPHEGRLFEVCRDVGWIAKKTATLVVFIDNYSSMQVIGQILQTACTISARPKGLAQVIARKSFRMLRFVGLPWLFIMPLCRYVPYNLFDLEECKDSFQKYIHLSLFLPLSNDRNHQ